MSQEIEIEYKNILSAEEFENLRRSFSIREENFTLQHNHYFDTADFMLKEKGCALRIREKLGKFTFTLKQPHENGHLETHQLITSIEYEMIMSQSHFPEGEVTEVIRTIGISPNQLVHFGTLATNRAEKNFQNGVLVLDHSFYFGFQDYELEYECNEKNKGKEIFYELLDKFQIPRRKTENKIKRMFNKCY